MPNLIDFSHQNKLDVFVADNIKLINSGINDFKNQLKSNSGCKFDETQPGFKSFLCPICLDVFKKTLTQRMRVYVIEEGGHLEYKVDIFYMKKPGIVT